MSIRSLPEIATEPDHQDAAIECIRALGILRADDDAAPRYAAAATTFALLAIADRIGMSGSGLNLVESIREASGIQP